MATSLLDKLRNLANDPSATPHEAEAARNKLAQHEERETLQPRPSGNHATLPDTYQTRNRLRQMPVGGSGWMVPWGMTADEQGRLYLHAEYDFQPYSRGTSCLYVERHADGYHVWLDGARRYGYTWDRSDSSWGKDIPVSFVHEGYAPSSDRRRI